MKHWIAFTLSIILLTLLGAPTLVSAQHFIGDGGPLLCVCQYK